MKNVYIKWLLGALIIFILVYGLPKIVLALAITGAGYYIIRYKLPRTAGKEGKQ